MRPNLFVSSSPFTRPYGDIRGRVLLRRAHAYNGHSSTPLVTTKSGGLLQAEVNKGLRGGKPPLSVYFSEIRPCGTYGGNRKNEDVRPDLNRES
jgi:hypothetical protein